MLCLARGTVQAGHPYSLSLGCMCERRNCAAIWLKQHFVKAGFFYSSERPDCSAQCARPPHSAVGCANAIGAIIYITNHHSIVSFILLRLRSSDARGHYARRFHLLAKNANDAACRDGGCARAVSHYKRGARLRVPDPRELHFLRHGHRDQPGRQVQGRAHQQELPHKLCTSRCT